jgi:poly-gamma-glutamate synthesis protein (capsule biosynthesis protein)
MLEQIFGEPLQGGLQLIPAQGQLARAWDEPDTVTVLPFEALLPRWKVLSLEGESPIRRDFDEQAYLLQMSFGLSGDPAARQEIAAALDWPESNRDPQRMTVVLMSGVSALTRATASRMEIMGVTYPGELIRDWTTAADFMHVSHEVAFAPDCPPPDPVQRGLRFCSAPENVELFEYIGVDLVELTGNHVNDWGRDALEFTLDLYRDRGIEYFGGGDDLERATQPVLVEHNGNRLAFIGCNYAGPPNAWASEDQPGSAPCDLERLYGVVRDLKGQGYVPIFTFQWHEYYTPRPVEQQQDLFREAARAGAEIVNGSQAHQPQAMEFYQDSFIHYGLGNLFFDQLWRLEVRQEFLDRHVFYDGRHISTELLTAMLEDWAQPRPMLPQEREVFLGDIFAASGW